MEWVLSFLHCVSCRDEAEHGKHFVYRATPPAFVALKTFSSVMGDCMNMMSALAPVPPSPLSDLGSFSRLPLSVFWEVGPVPGGLPASAGEVYQVSYPLCCNRASPEQPAA